MLPQATRAEESASALSTYAADPGPFPVATVRYTWTDTSRNRDVPVKIYYPLSSLRALEGEAGRETAGLSPVIIFSHGLGGTREGYEYLGRHWASYGYVSVHVQHLGSDDSVWRGKPDPLQAMKDSLKAPRNTLNRPRDIHFVLDQVALLNQKDPALAGRLDLSREGMAGHSFGGWTTMAVAGQVAVLPGGREVSFADPRFKAAIAMSAPSAFNRQTLDRAYAAITISVLHMTGTNDYSLVTDATPADKRIAFDHTTNATSFMLTFNGADHLTFSGHGQLPGGQLDAEFQPYILQVTTAFWDAYLKDDAVARVYLTQGGFATTLGEKGVWEQKIE
jgi:predicted dienelactone hydrolase